MMAEASDWLMASARSSAAQPRARAPAPRPTLRKGGGKGPEDAHVNAKLLRQLESQVRSLKSGAGLTLYSPSDDSIGQTLKEYQKKMARKNNTPELGPPERQSFAALLNAFSGWLEQQGNAQVPVKSLADVPKRLLLMMTKGGRELAITWVKECGTSTVQNSSIARISMKVLGCITLTDPFEPGPNALEDQEALWRTLADKDADEGDKRKAEARVLRSPPEHEQLNHGKVISAGLVSHFSGSRLQQQSGQSPARQARANDHSREVD
ncbi:unnamed protein product [Prorocentrum cordatum]|uniref:Uncharacterized protein n=1 Tax=Prorocentrum cordatum TaxID=2364126 RepID=A0ABN9WTE6_9DINO|nr:unnamed protein product [Polarella glacialis]